MGSRAVPWCLVSLALLLVSCTSVTAAISPSAPIATAGLAPSTTDPPVDVGPTTAEASDDAVPATSSTLPPSTSSTSSTSPATTVDPPGSLRLLFTGDVLMHSPLWRQAVRNGAGTPDFTPMFEHIEPLVQEADLAVCHMETPIAPPGEEWTTDPRYGVPGEVIDALAATGFDHCSTASNHSFDRGIAGVQATIDRFAAAGMTQHGMAATPTDNEPVLIDVDGVTIAHMSATYGFDVGVRPRDEPWRTSLIDAGHLIADAQLARARGADLVVASLHWGSSGSHEASEYQRAIANELAASGAIDLIIGHHAHVVQPIERIGNMWVAYGLGNLISNMPTGDPVWGDATRDGIILEVLVDRPAPGAVAISSVIARPVWVDRDAGWVVRDVATARLDPELTARIGEELDDSWNRTAAVVGPHLPQV